jgi:hypothetical protein
MELVVGKEDTGGDGGTMRSEEGQLCLTSLQGPARSMNKNSVEVTLVSITDHRLGRRPKESEVFDFGEGA